MKTSARCEIFTPLEIVNKMLDEAKYKGEDIINKTFLDNSCGDGNILCAAVERYIQACLKKSIDLKTIKAQLESNFVGIEIKEMHAQECRRKLSEIGKQFNINDVDWNIIVADALQLERGTDENHKTISRRLFDYIICNPPYIAYHHLDKANRKFVREKYSTCEVGKFDYCYAFIEEGLNKLATNAWMVYIVPSNIFKTRFGNKLRELMLPHIIKIIDYPLKKVSWSDDVLTSPSIIVFKQNSNQDSITYSINCEKKSITLQKTKLENKWIFTNKKNVEDSERRFGDYYKVSSSVATLANKLFVLEVQPTGEVHAIIDAHYKIEMELLRSAVSPKTLRYGNNKSIIFPYFYDETRELHRYPLSEFKRKFPEAYKYFLSKETKLLARDSDKNAEIFEYGRSQALRHLNQKKLVFSTLITGKVIVYEIEADVIPFSGLYIVPIQGKQKTLDEAKSILETEAFLEYIKRIGIPASGNSLRISSKDIENYRF